MNKRIGAFSEDNPFSIVVGKGEIATWYSGEGKEAMIYIDKYDNLYDRNGKPLNKKGDRRISEEHPEPSAPYYVTFESGAHRSEMKPRYDCLPKIPIVRLVGRYEIGLKKYQKDNWRKGLTDPVFMQQCLNHMQDHYLDYINGDRSEDHLAAIAWNAFTLMESEGLWKSPEAGDK